MQKFDIKQLHKLFDNIGLTIDNDILMEWQFDDLSTITYTRLHGEIIIKKEFPNGNHKKYKTTIPFLNQKDFVDTMARLGLVLISEETRTSTNSPIGSHHWFHTLMGSHLHMGEALSNPEYRDKFDKETVLTWSKNLFETSKELIRGFKYINNQL